MRLRLLVLLPIFSIILISAGTLDLTSLFDYTTDSAPSYIPNNRDLTPNGNSITDIGATLGRVLFYDKNLSLNNTTSCSSCHQQQFAFSDTNVVSNGFDGGVTGRHSMRLVNARYGREERFFWDARAADLEAQTSQPIQDFAEMGFSNTNGQPGLDSLVRKMDSIDYYPVLFEDVFGSTLITEQRIQFALAQFVRSILSFDSRYDEGLIEMEGNVDTVFSNFTDSENRGKDLFMNNQNAGGAGCNRCHGAPLFDMDNDRENNGVIGVAGNINATDLTNTRSPSLRDLINPEGNLNGPLMHDGSLKSIREMIDHYDNVPFNEQLDERLRRGGADGTQGQNLNLTEIEKEDLEAFLLTLTGVNIYTEEKWSDPFDENGNLIIIDGLCNSAQSINLAQDISGGKHAIMASDTVGADCYIGANATVYFQASTSINLNGGFEIEVGSILNAVIDDCISEE